MNIPTLQQLLEAGVHFGHQVRRGHPKMRPYIYGARDGVHIIDLTKSESLLKEACGYVKELGKQGAVILLVGTKKQARPIVIEFAQQLNLPYMAERWIGGFLTNFEEISKNIKKLKELKEQKSKGELSKYTKKEQLLLDRKMAKLERDFAGVMNLDRLPDAVFVVDTVSEDVAVKEARRKGLPVIAITDSNSDPTVVNYPIPGNDDAIKSIRILIEAAASSYEEGKQEAGKQAKKETDGEEDIAVEVPEDEIMKVEEEVEKEAVKESSRRAD